ncbi:MAG: hypothetical protein ACLPQS_16055 [Acidimicrobiales bacterium]
MEEPLLYIFDALKVPYGLLSSEESRMRSAASQLLRRTPVAVNLLRIEEDPKSQMTGKLWETLEPMLDIAECVITSVAEALGEGALDPLIGGYPNPNRARPLDSLPELQQRIIERVGPAPGWEEAVETLDDLFKEAEHDPTVLPEGLKAGPWPTMIMWQLIAELCRLADRPGWPIADNK